MSMHTDRRIRLAERVLAQGPRNYHHTAKQIAEEDLKSLRTCTKVKADEVVAYYFAQPGDEMTDIHKLMCIAPPWREFWIEGHAPKFVNDEGDITVWEDFLPSSWGIMVKANEYEGTPQERRPLLQEFIDEIWDGNMVAEAGKSPRWILQFTTYITLEEETVGPIVIVYTVLDDEGKVITDPEGKVPFSWGHDISDGFSFIYEDPEVAHFLVKEMYKFVQPLLVALMFMHFKNVTLADVNRDRAARRAVFHATGEGPVYFRTVYVDPMMEVISKATNATALADARALHKVRGHFVTYTEENPLGRNKVVGTFWRQAHMRGSRAKGLVIKDYDVGAPKANPKRKD